LVQLAKMRKELRKAFPPKAFQGELDICCSIDDPQEHIVSIEIHQNYYPGLERPCMLKGL
jgi:hypothetical protein